MWIDDQLLANSDQPCSVNIWVPETPIVVLGRSNSYDTEANKEVCIQKEITVLQRYGGGGTVVLYPGCLILSAGIWVKSMHNNQNYFNEINTSIINCLNSFTSKDLNLKLAGISDIANSHDRKIAGTSMFRSRNYLLFQASVICSPAIEIIESLLKHPSKEPEYRAGRSHSSFLSSLDKEDPAFSSPEDVSIFFKKHWESQLKLCLDSEIIDPIPNQIKNLSQRLQRKEGVVQQY